MKDVNKKRINISFNINITFITSSILTQVWCGMCICNQIKSESATVTISHIFLYNVKFYIKLVREVFERQKKHSLGF